jgi:hypothetical protein
MVEMTEEYNEEEATLSSPIGLLETSGEENNGFEDFTDGAISASQEGENNVQGQYVFNDEASSNEKTAYDGVNEYDETNEANAEASETTGDVGGKRWNEVTGEAEISGVDSTWPTESLVSESAVWTAYIDPESGQPYFVENTSGYKTWVKPENNNFVWGDHSDEVITRHFTTVECDGENLGPDFEETPWKVPEYDKAAQQKAENMFEQGKSSLCNLTARRLQKLGVGIRLYFEIASLFSALMFGAALLSIPALILYSGGAGIENSNLGAFSLAALSAGMYAPSQYQSLNNGTLTPFYRQETNFGSSKIERWRATYMVSGLDFVVSVVFFAAYFRLRNYVDKTNDLVDLQTTTTSDFSVEIYKGLPPDTTEDEVLEHFSSLYCLDKVDIRGRPAISKKGKETKSVDQEGIVKPVMDVEHVDGDSKYVGKWVAEVTLVKNNGGALLHYLHLSTLQKRVRQQRATIKKFSEGTVYSKGPNIKKVKKAEKMLLKCEFEEEMSFKSMEEKDDVVSAFVIFNHEESYLRCMEDYALQRNQRFCACCTKCHIALPQLRFRDRHNLSVRTAPEPGDVQFEYLSFAGKNWKRRCFGRVTVFLILLFSFLAIWIVHSVKRSIDKEIPSFSVCQSNRLTYALVGDNISLPALELNRNKGKDVNCRKSVSQSSYFMKVKGLDAFYTEIDACSAAFHSCIREKPSTTKFCPCVSASSTDTCVDQNGEDYPAKTIAGCYCINGLDKSLEGNGIAGGSRFLETDGDLCGPFLTDIARSGFLKFFGSVLVAGINIGITFAIKYLVKRERHTHVSKEEAQVVMLSLIGQFMNTSVIIILIYFRLPGSESSATPFLFNGEYDDLTSGWYAVVGIFIQTTILLSSLTSHLHFVIHYFFLKPYNTHQAKHNAEKFTSQQEMNDAIVGKMFALDERLASQLLLFAVPVVFSPGMPILLVIGACGLVLGSVIDKIDLARLSCHPPPVDATMPRAMVGVIPYLVCLRSAFATWVYSSPTIFASSTNDAEATRFTQMDQISMIEGSDKLSNRINSATVFHFVFFVLVCLYLVLRAIVWPLVEGVHHLLQKSFESIRCGKTKVKLLRPRSEGLPPFSDYYCDRLDKNFVKEKRTEATWDPSVRRQSVDGVAYVSPAVPRLSKSERLLGWRSVKASNFPQHNDDTQSNEKHWKVKTWMSNGSSRGVKHRKGQLKRTWEVCQESAPSSYRMHKHGKYAVIDELRNEKVSLHAPDDATGDRFVSVDKESGGYENVYSERDYSDDIALAAADKYQISAYAAMEEPETDQTLASPKNLYDVSSSSEDEA